MGGFLIINPYQNIFNEFSQDELLGKGNPPLFGKDFKLREEVMLQFNLMKKLLKKRDSIFMSFRVLEVIPIKIEFGKENTEISEMKDYPSNTIDKIIEYSTIPGTSRHHWGTDLDIIDTTKGFQKSIERGAFQ